LFFLIAKLYALKSKKYLKEKNKLNFGISLLSID